MANESDPGGNSISGSSGNNGATGGIAANSNMPNKIFVEQLQDRQNFQSYFLAKEKNLSTGRNGKAFVSVYLSDRSGAIDARIWDNAEAVAHTFESGDVVWIKGVVQIFQGRKQVVVHKLDKVDSHLVEMQDLLSTAQHSPEEMYQQLKQIAEGMQDKNIRQLTLDVISDPEVREKLLPAPAAKTIHHAYVGGLLEHVLSICGLMKALHGHYALQKVELKLDLLLFGAIFHDIGKIWELQVHDSISYSDKGKLLGHMMMAVELVERKTARISGFPDDLKDLLKHIILSHHGKLEYGSPKTPMFLEAFIVAAIDDLDSKINSIDQFVKSERMTSQERWSRFNPLYERYFLLRY